ncbi:DUF2726 domain-containing protein [Azonexus sp.]|uniref:DUF2726 domain-containing protein n=1 Tax=Azonexus sp. TaxID=1872668 RepID=UPI0028268D10|nr:DUF2726 domain-containing protein [Azonexus sp.]MDR1996470.1 DUF2726 domain-containing protein [Azonexus sp.]
MKTLIGFAALFVIAIFVIAVIAKLKGSGSKGKTPYFLAKPMTAPEQVLFHRLREAFPDAVVLAQVSMYAVIGIRKKGNRNERSQFNRIKAKCMDFVICNPDFSVRAAIELDDASHRNENRRKSDLVKNEAFEAVNCPLIRFDVRHMPGVEEIREAMQKVHY